MVENNQTIFRKKAMNRISSPEDLTGYLRVTSPGLWIILAAVIALLVGVFAWSAVDTLETTVDAATIVGNHTAYSNPLKYSHNQGERCSFLLYRGEKNQKRNSLEVLSIPTSAEVGSGRCPDTPRTFWKKFDQKLIVGHSAANSEYCYKYARAWHCIVGFPLGFRGTAGGKSRRRQRESLLKPRQ